MKTDIAEVDEDLQRKLGTIFGEATDTLADDGRRAAEMLPVSVIVWEGSGHLWFTCVSKCAEEVLGYSVTNWLELGFWATSVVHPEDQGEKVAFCALATAKGRDDDFQYRARRADGSVAVLHDMVHVIKGGLFVPAGTPLSVVERINTAVRRCSPARCVPCAASLFDVRTVAADLQLGERRQCAVQVGLLFVVGQIQRCA